MDDGYVIPGLNDDWQFLGAKVTEWSAGFVMFMMCSTLVTKIATAMPLLLLAWAATTISMAAVRRQFPDEEAGMRNYFMSSVGVPPPGIPAPAVIQPIWSGAPLRTLAAETEYSYLDLDDIFNPREPEEIDPAVK